MDYKDFDNNDIDIEKVQGDLIFLLVAYGCIKIIKVVHKMLIEGKFDLDNT